MNAGARAAGQLGSMTFEEKVDLLSGVENMYTKGVPRLGVRRLRMADASMGLRDEVIAATAFPASIALAATWSRDRARDYGAAVGEEFRTAGIDVVLGPGVNLYRVHECGRNFEYLGEDPWLAASLVVPYIRGVQEKGVAATVKHFVCNNTDWHRCVSNSIVDERTLRELYFLPFEAAVRDGHVLCMMTSYNLVNGEYAGESRRLLSDLVLDEWRFRGLIMSDWGGLWNPAPAVTSGLHLEMPEAKAFDAAAIRTMIEEGVIAQADVDSRALRVLELTARIEELQLEIPDPSRGRIEEHAGVALEVAREGIVLLKNGEGVLPLEPGATIAAVGPAVDPTPTSGGGAAAVKPVDPVSIAEAVIAVCPDTCLLREADGGIDEALSKADAALVCVGFNGEREREGCDRPYALPADQVALIRRAAATARRTIVVVVAGGGVEMSDWADDVDAILHLWYPGEIGARALAEILYGEVNPSGKLPISIERRPQDRASSPNYLPSGAELYEQPDYVSQDPPPYEVRYAEGVFAGYRHLDALEIEPLFAFGHGLSYTSYTYGHARVEPDGERLVVTFTITNDGDRDGKETAQVYAKPPASLADSVPRRLVGFAKSLVRSGESVEYRVEIPPRALASWLEGGWSRPAGRYTVEVGASSRDVRLQTEVELAEARLTTDGRVL